MLLRTAEERTSSCACSTARWRARTLRLYRRRGQPGRPDRYPSSWPHLRWDGKLLGTIGVIGPVADELFAVIAAGRLTSEMIGDVLDQDLIGSAIYSSCNSPWLIPEPERRQRNAASPAPRPPSARTAPGVGRRSGIDWTPSVRSGDPPFLGESGRARRRTTPGVAASGGVVARTGASVACVLVLGYQPWRIA